MKAAFYTENGAARDVLQVGDMPTPEPGANEVLVKVICTGVNPSDTKTRQGQPGRPLDGTARIPHNDGAGVIEAVGPSVPTGWQVGERVYLHNLGFTNVLGTAAEYLATSPNNLGRLPEQMTFAEGACLGVPLLTAYHGLMLGGDLSGKWVLVSGGAGAVGSFAIQLAKTMGAKVATTVSSEAKADAARADGADVTINYRTEDVAAAVKEATGGTGVDHVVEVDISNNAELLDGILNQGGQVATYGSAGATVTLDARMLRTRLASIHSYNIYEIPIDILNGYKATLYPLLADRTVKPRIAERFPLQEIAAAHEAVESGKMIGNAVVEIAEDA